MKFFQKELHLPVNFSKAGLCFGAPGNEYNVKPRGYEILQKPVAFPDEPFHPVALYALADLFVGRNTEPVRAEAVLQHISHDMFSREKPAFLVYTYKLVVFLQRFRLFH